MGLEGVPTQGETGRNPSGVSTHQRLNLGPRDGGSPTVPEREVVSPGSMEYPGCLYGFTPVVVTEEGIDSHSVCVGEK